MVTKRIGFWLVLVLVLSLVAGCSKKEESAGGEVGGAGESLTAVAYQPTGNEGTITGKALFEGAVPAGRKIVMDQDAVCSAAHPGGGTPEDYVVNDGKLANVFVYVKSGAEKYSFTVPATEVELDQQGCTYTPHIVGVMANQKLRILTKDPTTHNIHPLPKINPEWNETQAAGAPAIEKSFARPEVLIPVKCNQHPWMKAFIGVVKNPFFAVSAKDGSFTLKGLPPGDYEIEAIHEKLGTQTRKVTVGTKESKAIEFKFGAPAN